MAERMKHVYLMADLGNGRIVNYDRVKAAARTWWLVEAESVSAARSIIDASQRTECGEVNRASGKALVCTHRPYVEHSHDANEPHMRPLDPYSCTYVDSEWDKEWIEGSEPFGSGRILASGGAK